MHGKLEYGPDFLNCFQGWKVETMMSGEESRDDGATGGAENPMVDLAFFSNVQSSSLFSIRTQLLAIL